MRLSEKIVELRWRAAGHYRRALSDSFTGPLEGARALLDLGCTPADMAIPRDAALLRVPLFVQDRERVIARLEQRGLRTEYVYDPPLDLYAPGLAQRLPSPPTARIWSRDVLPVNPLLAGRFIALTREMPDLCTPIAD